MGWDWPVISSIKNKLWPDQTPDPTPEPSPSPPTPAPLPDVKPSSINAINYLRALMILRNIPLTKLREEFLKLPLKQIAYVCGVFIWIYMTYTFILYFLRALIGVAQ